MKAAPLVLSRTCRPPGPQGPREEAGLDPTWDPGCGEPLGWRRALEGRLGSRDRSACGLWDRREMAGPPPWSRRLGLLTSRVCPPGSLHRS